MTVGDSNMPLEAYLRQVTAQSQKQWDMLVHAFRQVHATPQADLRLWVENSSNAVVIRDSQIVAQFAEREQELARQMREGLQQERRESQIRAEHIARNSESQVAAARATAAQAQSTADQANSVNQMLQEQVARERGQVQHAFL